MKNIKTDEQLKKEMIKKVDIKKCKKFYAMCCNIQDNKIQGFDKLLQEWANQKVHLYKLLGEELKIVLDMNFSKEEALKKCKDSNDPMLSAGILRNKFALFVNQLSEKVPIFRHLENIFSYSEFAESFPSLKIGSAWDYTKVMFAGEEEVPFAKAMHRLFNNEIVDTEVSKFIQENMINNITGKLYISIDPFDYMTMSVNKSDWSSCLSLHKYISNDGASWGAYCSGTFSYMCDDATLVAYKTDGKEVKYNWGNRSIIAESKNWRQLIYMQKDFESFFNSRQYPFTSEFLCKLTREMIENQIGKNKETVETSKNENTYNQKWKVSRKYERNRNKIKDNKIIGIEKLHYNDILSGREFTLTYKKKYDNLNVVKIGSNPVCPLCGENGHIIENSSVPMCYYCYHHLNEIRG